MVESKGDAKEKPLRAVIYCRTSGDDSDLAKQEAKKVAERKATNPGAAKTEVKKLAKLVQKISIDEQRKLCLARCEKLGYEVVGTFPDINVSGRTYPEGFELADAAFDDYFNAHIKKSGKKVRPELGKLLKLKHIDVIVVRDIYRLLRPAFQSHLGNHLWQLLTKRGIRIHSISDGDIDTTKFEDLMITNLKLQIADQAKRQETEASIRSLHALKNDGKLATGVKCYGLVSRPGSPQTVDRIEDELKVVRIIYDKYLAGMTLFQIARYLNDDLKQKSRENKLWTVFSVRKLLLRPWYCGLQYNTDHQLIESKVLPHGADAVITKDEYYRVLNTFEKRKHYVAPSSVDPATGKIQPGPKIGAIRGDNGCHPLSGLVKCGICGKHMYIAQVVNKHRAEKTPIKQYHYICKTSHDTAAEEFQKCRNVRIKEVYPPEALALGIKPSGFGLLECLFPLIFRDYITRHAELVHGTTELTDKQSHLKFQMDQMAEYESRLFGQFEAKTVDDEQFATGMQRCREKREQCRRQMLEVEKALANIHSGMVTIPDELFRDHTKLPRETIQELAHATFKEILVYPDKITVVFNAKDSGTGQNHHFEIERLQNRNARDMPFWKAYISTSTITPNTKIGVTYFYKSTVRGWYRHVEVPYDDKYLEVRILGVNTSLDKKRAAPLPELTQLDEALKATYGEMPGYLRSIEVNSTSFLGNKMDLVRQTGRVPRKASEVESPDDRDEE